MTINEEVKTTLKNKMMNNELEPIHQVAIGVRYVDGIPSIVSSLEGNGDMVGIENYHIKIYVYDKVYGLAVLTNDQKTNMYVVFNNFLNLISHLRLIVDQFISVNTSENSGENDESTRKRLDAEYDDMCNKLIVKDVVDKIVEAGGNELAKYRAPCNLIANLINVSNKPYLVKSIRIARRNISFSYYAKCIDDIAFLLLKSSNDSKDSIKMFMVDLNDETIPTLLTNELRKEFSIIADTENDLDKVMELSNLSIDVLRCLNSETNNTSDLVTLNLYFRFDISENYIILKNMNNKPIRYTNLGGNLNDDTFVTQVFDSLPLITQLELFSAAEAAGEGECTLHQELNI